MGRQWMGVCFWSSEVRALRKNIASRDSSAVLGFECNSCSSVSERIKNSDQLQTISAAVRGSGDAPRDCISSWTASRADRLILGIQRSQQQLTGSNRPLPFATTPLVLTRFCFRGRHCGMACRSIAAGPSLGFRAPFFQVTRGGTVGRITIEVDPWDTNLSAVYLRNW